MGVGMSDEERSEMAMKDPEVQEILSDPVMRTILQQMQTDPGALKRYAGGLSCHLIKHSLSSFC